MNSFRAWLFRSLVIVAAGLMLLSWFMPWWSADVIAIPVFDAAVIHPWGVSLSPDMGEYVSYVPEGATEMPAWFAPMTWAYLGICIVLLLFSLLAKEKTFNLGKFKLSLPQVLIGGVGLSYILVVIIAFIVASIRVREIYGMHLIGTTFISFEPPYESNVETGFRFGYWLAWGVGLLCIALALLRDKIIGKAKLNVS